MPKAPTSEAALSLTGETFRKLTHLFALIGPLLAWLLGSTFVIIIGVPLTLMAIAADYFRVRSEGVKRLVEKVFGFTMRDYEKPPIGDAMILNGATWTMMSFTILLLLFDIGIAITMFSACMIGDAAAAMIGRRIGKHPWGRAGCTIEGSAAYFVFGLMTAIAIGGGDLITWTAYSFPLLSLAVGTFFGVIAEVIPLPVNDNLAAPFGSTLSMALVLQFVYDVPLEYFPVF